jgi:hypothetical protein
MYFLEIKTNIQANNGIYDEKQILSGSSDTPFPQKKNSGT